MKTWCRVRRMILGDSCPTRCLPTIHCFRLRIGHVFYFFFEKISISLPIMLSGFGQGSSNILPRRLSSSKILFSLFAIIIVLTLYHSSTSIASMKSEYSASNSLIFLIVISFFLEASINSVLDRSVSSNLLL